MLAVLVVQWALDFNFVPQQYAPFIVGTGITSTKLVRSVHNKLHQSLGFVAVTAGHSNTDPGAVRGSDKKTDFVVKVRNAVELYLLRAGLDVKTDGKGE